MDAHQKLAEEYWKKVVLPNILRTRLYKMKRSTDIDEQVILHLLKIVQDNGVTTYTSHRMMSINGNIVKITTYRFSL